MSYELVRDLLHRSLGTALMSERGLEAYLRPQLESLGLSTEEIDAAIERARNNLSGWKDESDPVIGEIVKRGAAGLLGTVGLRWPRW